MTRRSVTLAAALAVVGIAACSSDPDSSPPPPTAPIAKSTVDPSTAPGTDGTDETATSDAATTSSASEPSPTQAPTTTIASTSSTPPDPSEMQFAELATVSHPVNLAYRSGDDALYVVSRDGFIVAMRDGQVDETELLDIGGEIVAGGEQGLLGLAFSPDGVDAYVMYTNSNEDNEITEYAVGPDGVFDPASKRVLLTIPDPYPNHNGGQVRIGADGYLYIGTGDGGSGGDPQRRSLNVGDLLGKILRIDPTAQGNSPYGIPPDNPFVGVQGARAEIWTVGLRNPWRFSFDSATNDMWIADVGQGEWEEIDVAWADEGGGRGANFGWSAFEGTHPFNADQPTDGAIPPIFEYQHGLDGCSVSGGVRYRGATLPSLQGWYVYGDYCSGNVWALPVLDDRSAGEQVVLHDDIVGLSEIAQGPDGELFALSVDRNRIYAVVPSS